ncbi:MAG TPA: aspartate/glutamate racemase family protein [Thermoanaerobaculia bacterium]|jgi:glutamate racemase|nr:aspartate/glutamate racemase family protein [Thermoanaerobaculia bacterium]
MTVHIVITDSGVGGLSVVAYAERFVREHGFREPVRLTFANAAPENDYGYNAMPTREEKLQTFDRFLRNVTERFAPDAIYVACNTLSVLLPDTPYFSAATIPVQGIVETGVQLLLAELEADAQSVAMIFGTQTTIDAGTYPRLLEERGVDASRIVSQACPGLADTISEDREGERTAAEIRKWVATAIAKSPRPDAPIVACLACTHYGYRKDDFANAFADAGRRAQVVNPNESAVGDLFPAHSGAATREVDVQFVTRYRIPAATVETLTWFLSDIAPRTVEAMRNFRHVPDLF